jgi:hypothetical protein
MSRNTTAAGQVFVITDASRRDGCWRQGWTRVCAAARGVVAVVVLLAGAVDAWVTSLLGVPRVGWLLGQCAQEYRRARAARRARRLGPAGRETGAGAAPVVDVREAGHGW